MQKNVMVYHQQDRITGRTLYCLPIAEPAAHTHNAKLTRPFLSCEGAGSQD